jgi:hypothetical protein
LLVITRFTTANKKNKNKKEIGERLYYKFEDELFSKHADVSFSFKTTFREVDEDGNKISIVGGNEGEIHYKLVYVIKYSEYVKRISELG